MSLTPDQLAVLMSLPIMKKRRGRPPKYLDIWKQQYVLNMAAEMQAKAKKLAEEEATAKDLTNTFTTNTDETTRDETTNETAYANTNGEVVREIKRECPSTSSAELQSNMADTGSPEQPLSDGVFSDGSACGNNADASRCVSADYAADGCSPGADSNASAPPSLQPVKRRPGRPPGSTKKSKMQQQIQQQQQQQQQQIQQQQPVYINPELFRRDSEGDFTLRKFFEAGGRDYNDYLHWLKRKSVERNELATSPFHVYGGCPRPCTPPLAVARLPYAQHSPDPMSPPSPAVGFLPHVYSPFYGSGQVSPPSLVKMVTGSQSLPNTPGALPSPNQPACNGEASFDALDLSAKKRICATECETETEDAHKRMRLTTIDPGEMVDMSLQRIPTEYDKLNGYADSEGDIRSWDVDHVSKFVSSVPGCQDYAERFREHRIDGATLPHLSEGHLLNVVKMKLGPAIRLLLAVERLRGSVTS